MTYEVTKSIWFDKIGIVEVKTQFNGIKYYIGTGKGTNQKEDEQHIAKLGKPVNALETMRFFEQQKK